MLDSLGLLVSVAVAAAVGAAVGTAIVITIRGTITRWKLKKALHKTQIKEGMVTKIERCENRMRLEALDSGEKIEVRGDGVSPEVAIGDRIYA